VNGCVAFSIKNKPEGSGIDNYTVKFFNDECFEEGELMSQSDFTVGAFSVRVSGWQLG
jgi:hypothetical protein